MAYQIPQSDPESLTTEELQAELQRFTALAAEVVQRYAAILAVLRKRRQPSTFFAHPVLRFFQEIVDHQLEPKAALTLANRDMIKAVMPLPYEDQRAVAFGRAVPVAVLKADGSIGSDDVPIQRMDSATLKRAFGPEGIRDVWAQSQMIRDQGQVERHGMITVFRDEMLLKVGNQKIKPEDLVGPLAVLGYSLKLARDAKGEAA